MNTAPAARASHPPIRPAMRLEAMEVHAGQAESLLRAMANRHRLMVLCTLCAGELTVSEINERLPLSQSALSQHLAVLRQEGLVSTRRESRSIYYRIPDGPALQIIAVLYDAFCRTRPRRTKRKPQ